jgi:hypothetical protein
MENGFEEKTVWDPTKFDMFRLKNDDARVSLQAPISIDKAIQPIVIMGGFTIIVVPNGGEDDGTNSDEEYVKDSNSDG